MSSTVPTVRPPTRLDRYIAACRHPLVWRRALCIGLPVGLLQAALNQGDHWWHLQIDATIVAKTVLSPLISCSTAFVSGTAAHATHSLNSSNS